MPGERAVAIRLAVLDAELARQRLLELGKAGQEALRKIEASAPGASTSLGGVDQASGRAGRAARGLGADIGGMARDVATGNASIESLTTSVALAATRFGLWGIAAAAAITTAAALWQSLRDLGDETDDAADAAERMSEVQDALKGLLDDSTTTIRDQVAAVSQLGGAARAAGEELLRTQATIKAAQLDQEVGSLRDQLTGLRGELLQPSANEVVGKGPIIAALSAIEEALARDDPGLLGSRISALVRQMSDPALVTFQENLAASSARIITLTGDTKALDDALGDLGEGAIQTSKQIETATRDAARAAEQAARDVEKLAAQRERTADAELAALKKMAQEIDREAARTTAAEDRRAQQQADQQRRDLEREAAVTARLMTLPFETPLCTMRTLFQATAEALLA